MSIFHDHEALPLSIGEISPVRIKNTVLSPGSRPFIIAEIGTSHGGDLGAAFRLIEEAARAGADCAKFQAVIAEEIVHPLTGKVKLPGGATPLFEVFRQIERDGEFYAKLKEKTETTGMVFLCTPFGPKSAAMLKDIGVDAVKIASPEINHIPLLEEVASWGVPVVLSTGVSVLADIETALSILPKQTIVLHCVTAYPAPEAEYNVLCVPVLSAGFGRLAGISDHSLDPAFIPALSVAVGGCIIEKHFTLDRNGIGLDDPVALTPEQFGEMVAAVREVERMSGDDKFTYLYEKYSRRRVVEALGSGVKRLASSERDYYRTTNRSIMAVREIREGSTIEPDAVALLRSEKNLPPGLAPAMLPTILGKKAARTIKNGAGINWDDLLRT